MVTTDAKCALDAARRDLALTQDELWTAYLGLGGTASPHQLDDYLAGGSDLTRLQHNTIVQALNEEYTARGRDHPVPYEETE